LAVNPHAVKSTGQFENIAPEARTIIKPKYADPKIQVVLNVERNHAAVQRTEWLGNTPVLRAATEYVPSNGTFNDVNYIDSRKLLATDTEHLRVNTIHPVMVNTDTGKAVEIKNNKKEPVAMHGLEPRQHHS